MTKHRLTYSLGLLLVANILNISYLSDIYIYGVFKIMIPDRMFSLFVTNRLIVILLRLDKVYIYNV